MNTSLFSICLFVFWTGVALLALVIGPAANPKLFEDSSRTQLLGVGAGMLALWNLVRWSGIRSYEKTRALEKAERIQVRRPLESERDKEVVRPEFSFVDDPPVENSPSPPRNGTAH